MLNFRAMLRAAKHHHPSLVSPLPPSLLNTGSGKLPFLSRFPKKRKFTFPSSEVNGRSKGKIFKLPSNSVCRCEFFSHFCTPNFRFPWKKIFPNLAAKSLVKYVSCLTYMPRRLETKATKQKRDRQLKRGREKQENDNLLWKSRLSVLSSEGEGEGGRNKLQITRGKRKLVIFAPFAHVQYRQKLIKPNGLWWSF